MTAAELPMERDDEPEPFLTVREVSDRLRVSRMTIHRLCRGGSLPYYRVGRSIRIKVSVFNQYLQQAHRNDETEEEGPTTNGPEGNH